MVTHIDACYRLILWWGHVEASCWLSLYTADCTHQILQCIHHNRLDTKLKDSRFLMQKLPLHENLRTNAKFNFFFLSCGEGDHITVGMGPTCNWQIDHTETLNRSWDYQWHYTAADTCSRIVLLLQFNQVIQAICLWFLKLTCVMFSSFQTILSLLIVWHL